LPLADAKAAHMAGSAVKLVVAGHAGPQVPVAGEAQAAVDAAGAPVGLAAKEDAVLEEDQSLEDRDEIGATAAVVGQAPVAARHGVFVVHHLGAGVVAEIRPGAPQAAR